MRPIETDGLRTQPTRQGEVLVALKLRDIEVIMTVLGATATDGATQRAFNQGSSPVRSSEAALLFDEFANSELPTR